jgi:ADP-heptose:LPS heptosyltransferase
MGDVALLAPVVRGVTENYADVEITVLTRPKFAWFFKNMSQISVFDADIDKQYKGFLGLWRLFLALKKENFSAIIDIHDNLRTKILRAFFKLMGTKIVVFDKGRNEKKTMVRKTNKIRTALPHTTERYADAFAKIVDFLKIQQKLVNSVILPKTQILSVNTPIFAFLDKNIEKKPLSFGIAPFAKHETKQWGILNIINLIGIFIKNQPQTKIYLFGGGAAEVAELEKIKLLFDNNIEVAAGKYTMQAEIELMQTLNFMLCMDSSNLHLAALAGVKTVSIWGATHPDIGFSPFGKPEQHLVIQADITDVSCRPCSVFGDKSCHRNDKMCMSLITPEFVFETISTHDFYK